MGGHWTKEIPSEAGLYWQVTGDEDPQVVSFEYDEDSGELEGWYIGWDCPFNIKRKKEDFIHTSWWNTQIESPPKPKKVKKVKIVQKSS